MNEPIRIDAAGQVIHALSIGGIETCFEIPAYDCNLDIGRCPPGALRRNRLFLTHAHMDHAGGLPYYVSMRAMQGMRPPKVFCPASVRDELQSILELWSKLDSDATRCTLIGLEPGERLTLGGDKECLTFAATHRVDTLGYLLVRKRRKLKPDLRGLDGTAIAARAAAGEVIHDEVEVDEICFPGDTSIEVLEREPRIRQARLLLLECTFIGEKPGREWAGKGGHIHIEDIAERADWFENERLVLTHFSRRYSSQLIRETVERTLPPSLRERVQLLLHP
ncbi:MAG: MBL fold metallo-hydrolase [Myxococcota bacterium]